MPVSRPSDQVEEWIEESLRSRDEGEEIEYELLLAPHPQAGVIGVLHISIPSFTLGESVALQSTMALSGATQESIDGLIHESLMQLRSQRSTMAREQINGNGLTLPPSLG